MYLILKGFVVLVHLVLKDLLFPVYSIPPGFVALLYSCVGICCLVNIYDPGFVGFLAFDPRDLFASV